MFWLPESRGTKRRLQSLWGQPQLGARPAHCTMVPRGTSLPVCSPPHCEERKAQRDEAMDSSTSCKWEPGSWHSNSGAACTMFATSKQHPEVRSFGDRQALPYMSRWLWLNSETTQHGSHVNFRASGLGFMFFTLLLRALWPGLMISAQKALAPTS